MSLFPWKVKRVSKNKEDKQLEIIKGILFPEFETMTEEVEGRTIKYHVDHSVDTNLDAALIDLQEGQPDKVTEETINTVIKKLQRVRRMLDAYSQFDPDVEYIVVNIEDDENPVE